jgi:phenylpropionate dioxygenase-like ring-hydroxylating dioxygenase large terminal subunit
LTGVERGSSEQLKCQYHGWEYDAEGRTGRIPDAQSFRPFDRENSCLTRFRVETCGDLVFVSMADDGPSLEASLGLVAGRGADSFGGRYQLAGTWQRDFACNWKVIIENSLESYHLPSVHPKTFGMYSPEEDCSHVLEDRYTMSRIDKQGRAARKPKRWRGRFRAWWRNWLPARLGVPARYGYEHLHVHPHMTVASNLFHRQVMIVHATSPATCRVRHYAFALRGDRGGLLAPILARGVRLGLLRTTKRLFEEDSTIYEEVQRGLVASPHPGVIGTREERIYAFHEYLLARCGGSRVGSPMGTDAETESLGTSH